MLSIGLQSQVQGLVTYSVRKILRTMEVTKPRTSEAGSLVINESNSILYHSYVGATAGAAMTTAATGRKDIAAGTTAGSTGGIFAVVSASQKGPRGGTAGGSRHTGSMFAWLGKNPIE